MEIKEILVSLLILAVFWGIAYMAITNAKNLGKKGKEQ